MVTDQECAVPIFSAFVDQPMENMEVLTDQPATNLARVILRKSAAVICETVFGRHGSRFLQPRVAVAQTVLAPH